MTTPPTPGPTGVATPETIGTPQGTLKVEVSPQFLHHFSEQLYSSPQKAFEELISNGWDAGADYVDVRVSSNLGSPTATLCVLDNGVSMDVDGLRQLWHIAFSPKSGKIEEHGRKLIGQFGIGKLATYVLANTLTYICKAADGQIRRVTMHYDRLATADGADPERLLNNLDLPWFNVSPADLAAALTPLDNGPLLLDLIRSGVTLPPIDGVRDEFGGDPSVVPRVSRDTWTLVILSDLKSEGRNLKVGVLKRMLEAALPFNTVMAICLNGDRLVSSKIDTPLKEQWTIGPGLPITSVEIDYDTGELVEEDANGEPSKARKTTTITIPITSGKSPTPHVTIPHIGDITGTVSLFDERVSGGKSDERGYSNGFLVNVLGRVVNQSDSTFAERNLNHAVWAKFRMAVRADGLNRLLATDREKFRDSQELRVFRAFLRKVFNVARKAYDSDPATMPDGGDVLVRSLGVLSLNPLRNVVSETLRVGHPPIPQLFDDSDIEDRKEKRRSWREDTAENIRSALGEVKFERMDDQSFVKFRISDSTIIVNKDHPFVVEHFRTMAEKELLRTFAMVTLLSDVYALDRGIEPATMEAVRHYRDRLLRFRAMQRRQSARHIAALLLATQNDSRLFENVVPEAIACLGYEVTALVKPGKPPGVARAYPFPTRASPSAESPNPPLYSFLFDTRSSQPANVADSRGMPVDGVIEHRARHKADHALIIAPAFSDRALARRLAEHRVTPLTARDLGRLLEYTFEYGAIPLTHLRELFQLYKPGPVADWIENLEPWLRRSRPLTISVFLRALDRLKGKIPDALSAGTLAYACRELLEAKSVKNEDVIAVAKGLAILIPDLVGVEGDSIVVNASSDHIAKAVEAQLEALRSESVEASPKNG